MQDRDKYKTYKDILDKDDGYHDIRETHRKALKMDHFSKECSEVLTNFLYVGGIQISQDLEILKDNKITHVINAAGDLCENHFTNEFEYLTFFLKDSKNEVNHPIPIIIIMFLEH